MARVPFSFSDFQRECQTETGHHRLDNHLGQRMLGLRVIVPPGLQDQYPFNASAYALMQQLRAEILEYGILEFPGLPVNKTNHTLAQRAPAEHSYSSNTYLTDYCQVPHQDIPPFPSAFWLGQPRRFSATWVLSNTGVQAFMQLQATEPALTIDELHRRLVPTTLLNHTGLLLNHSPGLALYDNSDEQQLYHARTCNFDAVANTPAHDRDTPMYAYNEPGLLNCIDTLDSRRGNDHRCSQDLAEVQSFLQKESSPARF